MVNYTLYNLVKRLLQEVKFRKFQAPYILKRTSRKIITKPPDKSGGFVIIKSLEVEFRALIFYKGREI